MSKLYPEMKKKEDTRSKVTCLSCEALEFQDKGEYSYCPTKRKNIQPDQLTELRVCRGHEP